MTHTFGSRTTTTAFAALTALTAITVSGCSGSSSHSAASHSAAAAHPAQSSASHGSAPQSLTQGELLDKIAQAEKSAGSLHVDISITQSTGSLRESADVKPGNTSTQALVKVIQSSNPQAQGIREIIDGDTLYAQMPNLARGQSKSTWYKMPPNSQTSSDQQLLKPFSEGVGHSKDPDAQTKLTQVSSENGQTTYRLTVSPAKFKTELKQRGMSDAEASRGSAQGATTLTTVDSQWRPVKSVITTASSKIVSEYSKWGEPISIEIPKNAQEISSNGSGSA